MINVDLGNGWEAKLLNNKDIKLTTTGGLLVLKSGYSIHAKEAKEYLFEKNADDDILRTVYEDLYQDIKHSHRLIGSG